MNLLERVELLTMAEKDTKLQAVLMELCRKDIIYWFNTFCWTFDPRAEDSGNADIPFNLFPYQEWCVQEWYDNIEKQKGFGIEKSRDMGVSYMLMYIFQYGWLFRPGWNFLVGSYKEAEVDNAIIDPSNSLFGKFRYNLYLLPRWMRPPEDKIKDKKLNIQNLQNGNILTGDTANPNFGRGARQRAILVDEFAFWEHADKVWGGMSATTNCRIANSTPCGETNRYAKIMLDANNELREVPEAYQLAKV